MQPILPITKILAILPTLDLISILEFNNEIYLQLLCTICELVLFIFQSWSMYETRTHWQGKVAYNKYIVQQLYPGRSPVQPTSHRPPIHLQGWLSGPGHCKVGVKQNSRDRGLVTCVVRGHNMLVTTKVMNEKSFKSWVGIVRVYFVILTFVDQLFFGWVGGP